MEKHNGFGCLGSTIHSSTAHWTYPSPTGPLAALASSAPGQVMFTSAQAIATQAAKRGAEDALPNECSDQDDPVPCPTATDVAVFCLRPTDNPVRLVTFVPTPCPTTTSSTALLIIRLLAIPVRLGS